jgi:formamidopyrimidine-DNA glycosylase
VPELPEVETTMQGVKPYLLNREILGLEVREPRLRWPIPNEVQQAVGQRVQGLERRAKYILVRLGNGALMLHLGMSGSLRVITGEEAPRKHDHFEIITDTAVLRFNDPRRFGSLLWAETPAEDHPLLRDLGPEPLSGEFDGAYLRDRAQGRRLAVKSFIMDGRVVVGVGNIYASEALFMAGIHPTRPAGRISLARYQGLAAAVRDVLRRSIEQGGTTLRDYVDSTGNPGYFARDLLVYGRKGQACFQCGFPIRQKVIGQRASYYCIRCQR